MRLELAQRIDLPFDRAWEVAWARVKWPHDTAHRREWKRALAWTRRSWELAYSGQRPVVDESPVLNVELVA